MPAAPERLHLHTTRSARFSAVQVVVLVGVAGLVGSRFSTRTGVIAAGATAAVGLAAFVLWRWREGLVLTATTFERRRLVRRTRIPWTDIVALVATSSSAHRAHGAYDLRLVTWSGAGRVGRADTELPERSLVGLRSFVAGHGIDVGIEVTPARDDQRRQWHRELKGLSPETSLRAVRRAAVGPWLVRISVAHGTFQAVVEDAHTSVVRERGPVRPTLAEAITDGEAMIAELKV